MAAATATPADPVSADSPAHGPIAFTGRAHTTLRPAPDAHITGGLWRARRAANSRAGLPSGYQRLVEAGNLDNLRLAAGETSASYSNDLPFMDSDLHKWLEAAAWQLADPANSPELTEELTDRLGRTARLLAAAQEPSGYLQSFYQVVEPGKHFTELAWGHELYCAGHLIQAAVAHARTTRSTELLDVARRLADHVDAVFGTPDEGGERVDGVCGHPEIETALVELYRHTGERRYLERARYFVDRRGHGLLPHGRFGSRYWQDHVPVREAESVAGHAVRQLYLLAGVVDVYAETGDRSLLRAAERLWEEMAARRTYLTGGVGSRHKDEAFGDPYELPPERAYTETCAAIASVMLSWRLLLATGRARYADHVERVLLNGFLSGVSLDGEHFVYVNPLRVRDDHVPVAGDHGAFRTGWFHCACCPPNVMRLLASLPHYMAASDGSGLVLHQYANGSYAARIGADAGAGAGAGAEDDEVGQRVAVEVATDYPWSGRIEVTVVETPGGSWPLTLRVPDWAAGRWRASVSGEEVDEEDREVGPGAERSGWLRLERRWRTGETVVLELEMAPRLTAASDRVDAVRGCVALERGPLVYCVEAADLPDGVRLEDVTLVPGQELTESERPDLLGGVVTVGAVGRVAGADDGGGAGGSADDWWPYGEVGGATGSGTEPRTESDEEVLSTPSATVELTAVPYHLWAHREQGPMRVWLPLAGADAAHVLRTSSAATGAAGAKAPVR